MVAVDTLAGRLRSAHASYAPSTRPDDVALFQTLAAWREKAWRNAEALAAAPTPEARDEVVAAIEDDAATEARAIAAATSYSPLSQGSGPRDAYCAVHHGDP